MSDPTYEYDDGQPEPVPAPAEPAQEVCGKVAHNRFGIIHCDLPPNHEGDCDFGKVPTEPPHVACSCPMCCPVKYEINAALANAAEYTCPRCGSKISTHICMKAEPVAGETKRYPDCPAHGIHSQRHFRKPDCPAPAVAAPAEGSAKQLLELMYDRWEEGISCYEDPEQETGYLGRAIKLEFEEENQIIAVIGKECTRASTPPTADPQWRVGKQVPLNVYEGDRPVCQCHTEEDARRIVEAVNGRS